MQTTTQSSSAASSGAPLPVTGVPQSRQELAALKARRDALSDQLQSADGRRSRLVKQLETQTGANREAIEERIALLDKRILQLETDIAETGRQLTLAPASLLASSSAQPPTPPWRMTTGFDPDDVLPIVVVFIIFVLTPLSVALARLLWRRASAPPRAAVSDGAQRLERLEQAVDTVAVEIERIAEGQRFVTRLLTEAREVPSLLGNQRSAEPAPLAGRDGLRRTRDEP